MIGIALPILAGLGALCMSNPRRRKRRRNNPAGISLAPYKKEFRVKGIRGNVTILSPAIDRSNARRFLKAIFPTYTKADHARAAKAHELAAKKYDDLWHRVANKASTETTGRKWHMGDYRISGIGRDIYPERLKNILRSASFHASDHRILSRFHEFSAGTKAMRDNPRGFGASSYHGYKIEVLYQPSQLSGGYWTATITKNGHHIYDLGVTTNRKDAYKQAKLFINAHEKDSSIAKKDWKSNPDYMTVHLQSAAIRTTGDPERDLANSPTVQIRVQDRKGWIAGFYKGKRYQVFGGIRTAYWINLDMPIKGK